MREEDTLNLKQFQEKFGIKRIDFSEIKKTGLERRYGTDELICPYCGTKNALESEHYDDVLHGTAWQCWNCDKYFYVTADVSIDTYCEPLEDAIKDTWIEREIRNTYDHCDKCEEAGLKYPENNPYGFVEWHTFKDYAEPLFSNMKTPDALYQKIRKERGGCGADTD